MKDKRILIGGLIGGVIAILAMVLPQTTNGDWFWWFDFYAILLALGCYFAPGFAAGAFGTAILTKTKLLTPMKQTDNSDVTTDEPDNRPVLSGIGKSVLGGLLGVLIFIAILFGFFLIVAIIATDT